MEIRPAYLEDLNAIMDVLVAAKGIMHASGNMGQWINGYPGEDVILADISNGYGRIVTEGERVVGYFAFSLRKISIFSATL